MLADLLLATEPIFPRPLATLLFGLATCAIGLLLGRFIHSRKTPFRVAAEPARTLPLKKIPDEPGSELRVHPRYESRNVKLQVGLPGSALPPMEGLVINQSLGGLCVCVRVKFEAGTILQVRSLDPGNSTSWIPVQVRHCRLQRGGWALGCQYVNGPSPAGLHFG